MINNIRLAIRNDLEAPAEARTIGSGWLSGVAALVIGIAGLFLILSSQYSVFFSTKELGGLYKLPYLSLIIQILLGVGFALACINMMLRRNRVLGFSAIAVVFLATIIGEMSSGVTSANLDSTHLASLGLDWFVLNLLFTGLLFVPLEKMFGRLNQPLFRTEWREDLFYFLLI